MAEGCSFFYSVLDPSNIQISGICDHFSDEMCHMLVKPVVLSVFEVKLEISQLQLIWNLFATSN